MASGIVEIFKNKLTGNLDQIIRLDADVAGSPATPDITFWKDENSGFRVRFNNTSILFQTTDDGGVTYTTVWTK